MRERATLIGANLVIDQDPQAGGCRVRLEVPTENGRVEIRTENGR
jgi:signal transduction histidine kinase